MARILVVEDDTDLAEMIQHWLCMERHSVDVVNSGIDAAPMLKITQYDLLIVDWMMPGLSGLELCKQCRSVGLHVPILMLTGKHSIKEKEQGFDAGVDDYLTKPFHMTELVARARALLRRPRSVWLLPF